MKKLGKKSPLFDLGKGVFSKKPSRQEKREVLGKKSSMNSITRPQFFEKKAAERDNLLQLISSRESVDRISSMSYPLHSQESVELHEPSQMTEGFKERSRDQILLEEMSYKPKSRKSGYLRVFRSNENL